MLPGSPAEFGKLIAEETEKWAKVVKFSGARADPRDAKQTRPIWVRGCTENSSKAQW